MRQSKSSATSSGIDAEVSEIQGLEAKLSNNSRQWQHTINKQEAEISSLQDENKQLKGLLDPKVSVDAISQAVTTGQKSIQLSSKGGAASNGTRFVSKPYLRKPRPSQLAPDADRSLNLALECWYCKDTGHLKENIIKQNHGWPWGRRMSLPTQMHHDQNQQTEDSFVKAPGQRSSQ